jgi:hypothetical protein
MPLQIFFNSYTQLSAAILPFAEKAKMIGELVAGNGMYNGGIGVVDNLETDFIAALDKYLKENRDLSIESEFYYMNGKEQFIQPDQFTNTYVPKWKIAVFFFHRKQAGVPVKFDPFMESGVCDVCNTSLDDKMSYIVPNAVFYHSPRYQVHYLHRLDLFEGKKGSLNALDTAAIFAGMQAEDSSQVSAVCENCIYMFE